MYNVDITLLENGTDSDFDPDPEHLRRVALHVLQASQSLPAQISVAVVDDATIRRLKYEFFDMDVVTDVISFKLNDDDDPELDCEVVINAQLAARLAAQNHTHPMAELALYLTHGLLHQLGYDDQTPQEAARMHQREDQLLSELGWGSPYSEGDRQ